MMRVDNVERRAGSTVRFDVVVDSEQFEKAVNQIYLKDRGQIFIPGFRKGKAPRMIIEGMYGKNVFYSEAVESLTQEAYDFGRKEGNFRVVGQGSLENSNVTEEKELVLTFSVPVWPETKLGQYKGLEAPRADVEVTEQMVDEYIENERKRNGRKVTVERPAQNGDTLVLEYEQYFEGKTIRSSNGNEKINLGEEQLYPGLDAQLEGISAGEEKDITVAYQKNASLTNPSQRDGLDDDDDDDFDFDDDDDDDLDFDFDDEDDDLHLDDGKDEDGEDQEDDKDDDEDDDFDFDDDEDDDDDFGDKDEDDDLNDGEAGGREEDQSGEKTGKEEKTTTFHVLCREVKGLELPELDDEFAKDVSECDTLEEYRAQVREQLEKSFGEEADDAFHTALLRKALDNLEVDIPETMIETEIERSVEYNEMTMRLQGYSLNQYLRMAGITMDQFHSGLRPSAVEEVRKYLLLDTIATLENIEATPEEIEKTYKDFAEQNQMSLEEARTSIDEEDAIEQVRYQKAMQVIFDTGIPVPEEAEETKEPDWEPAEKETQPEEGAGEEPEEKTMEDASPAAEDWIREEDPEPGE